MTTATVGAAKVTRIEETYDFFFEAKKFFADWRDEIVAEKGITDAGTLRKYYEAWDHAADRTPHGMPIELRPEDFR